MRRFQNKEFTSDENKDDETINELVESKKDERKKKGEDEEERERTVSGGESVVKEEEIQFGEQLQDDLINSFCDKLQAVSPRKIEALLAIQFLLITDMTEIQKHVTGKNMALQVLYDTTRAHYLLVHHDPQEKSVVIYDSLQIFEKNGDPRIINEISTQIIHLFGHLFTECIPVVIDKEYEAQEDNFSCGYRVIGSLVDLARDKEPESHRYSRSRILNFMRIILREPNPTWEMFKNASFGKEKEYNGNKRYKIFLENTSYVPPTATSSTQSTRTSSTDSLTSICSKSSQNSQNFWNPQARRTNIPNSSKSPDSTRRPQKRANAGFIAYEEEKKEDERECLSDMIPFRFSEEPEYSRPTPSQPIERPSELTLFEYAKSVCHSLWVGLFHRPKIEENGGKNFT